MVNNRDGEPEHCVVYKFSMRPHDLGPCATSSQSGARTLVNIFCAPIILLVNQLSSVDVESTLLQKCIERQVVWRSREPFSELKVGNTPFFQHVNCRWSLHERIWQLQYRARQNHAFRTQWKRPFEERGRRTHESPRPLRAHTKNHTEAGEQRTQRSKTGNRQMNVSCLDVRLIGNTHRVWISNWYSYKYL